MQINQQADQSIEGSMMSKNATGIEVKLGFFPLAFFLFACTPRVEIDGVVHKKYWGTHFIPTSPGRHIVKIYVPYMFLSQCGANSIDVDVSEVSDSRVSFYMPPWIYAKGFLKVNR
ncbi:MAG: hypothetical protein ACI9G1_004017 [Pirellulaceae bacterium]